MIFGSHLIVYSKDAAVDREFFRDVLGLSAVDAGNDWLVFALPPAEAAVHPTNSHASAELYLMCTDLEADIKALAAKGVSCAPVEQARWGSMTRIPLPGGGDVGLYQPRHPLAIADPNASTK
jgi:hypothetical protein